MKLKDNKDVLYGSLLITKITPIQKKMEEVDKSRRNPKTRENSEN